MILFHDLKLAYVHIPRTSGIAFREAIKNTNLNYQIGEDNQTHFGSRSIRELYCWHYQTFTIIRHPLDIFASRYIWMKQFQTEDLEFKKYLDIWQEATFEEYTINLLDTFDICNYGGFWLTYCVPETIVFKYEDRPYRQIAALLKTKLNMTITNESKIDKPKYSKQLSKRVQDFCYYDFKRGFYERA